MHIRLTEVSTNAGMTLGAQTILMCRRDKNDIGSTHVMTGIMGPQGLIAFAVKETPEEIALMINAAEKSEIDPSLIGLGRFSDSAGQPYPPAPTLIPA